MATVIDRPTHSAATPPPHPRAGPGTIVKRVLMGLCAFIVLLLVVIALLPDSLWKAVIVHVVAQQTHRAAAIDGPVKLHIFTWSPRVTIDGFRLANADWKKDRPMLTVQRIDVTVSLMSLLKLRPEFSRIEIVGPDVDLERLADNRANWDFAAPGAQQPKQPDTGPATHVPVIKQLILSDGKLLANDRVKKLRFDGTVGVAEKQGSNDEDAMSVKGKGSLNEKPFELTIGGGPLINVTAKEPYRFSVAVTAADIHLTAQTEIVHPFDLAEVRSQFHITGQDLADVYYLTELALPNTPPYDLAGTIVRDNLKFQIDDFKGRLGTSDLEGQISIDTGLKRPKLTADLTSKALDLKDLAAPLGTQADAASKSGTLSATGTKAPSKSKTEPAPLPPAEAQLLLPDADLQVNRVRAMDADVKYDAASIVAGKMPMKKVGFHLLLDNGKLSLAPLSFTLPQGRVSGDVTIDARGKVPATTLDIKLDSVDLGQFKPASASTPPLSGSMVGRLQLHGTGSSVHKTAADANGVLSVIVPQGEMRAAFAELMGINIDRGLGLMLTKKDQSTAIRCGVFNFKADNGVLKTYPLVLDTTHVVVTGEGDINLQTESINLSLKGKPKEIRVFRLRTPILIGGTLSHPTFGVEPAHLIGQAGAAVAMGALLTPVAAILAFVDPGLGKDANCAQLIGQNSEDHDLPAAQ